MSKPKPPCGACKQHRPGCHNPETCQGWKSYLQQKAAYDSTIADVRAERDMMHDYGATRYQNLKGRIRDAE